MGIIKKGGTNPDPPAGPAPKRPTPSVPSSSPAPVSAPTIPQKFKHSKSGRFYLRLFDATHSETQEPLIVYQALYGDHKIWVRPASMWSELVEIDGKQVPRFVPMGSDDEFKTVRGKAAYVEIAPVLEKLFDGTGFGTEVNLEEAPDGRIGGYVVSDGFRGMTQIERADCVWGALSRDAEWYLEDIVMILTFTKAEVEE